MTISEDTKVLELLDQHPYLLDTLIEMSSEFRRLENPLLRRTLGRRATLRHAAKMSGIPFEELRARIEKSISAGKGAGGGSTEERATRISTLKQIIRDLHEGRSVEEQKQKFAELIGHVSAPEIAAMEQELMNEGMPEAEIKRLCDVHVQVMAQSFETKKEELKPPPGHPVHTFLLENKALQEVADELKAKLESLKGTVDAATAVRECSPLFEKLFEVEKHFLRKENQFFPVLEHHGITAPSKVMWALHDDIRDLARTVRTELAQADAEALATDGMMLVTMITDMIYKEEQVLFPLSMETLSEDDWGRVREGDEDIGYTLVQPAHGWAPPSRDEIQIPRGETFASLNVGALSTAQIDLLLTHLPVDITFVDEHDRVRYYSAGKERIFPRSPGIIGRNVQNCHPPASVHVVERIVEAFRNGEKDFAEFWIQMKERFIHIRYFAMRDGEGAYRGTLEVSQDVTGIRSLEGERRLLDW